MRKKVLIVAPHIDDETIGCWSIINTPASEIELQVVFLFELEIRRMAEAKRMSENAPSQPFLVFLPDREPQQLEAIKEQARLMDEVYVPHYSDNHVDHKWTSAEFHNVATHFYSVDMKNGRFLGAEAELKQSFLNICYPSQKTLWERDHKYFLFEAIKTTNYDEYRTLTWGDYAITLRVDQWPKMQPYLDNTFGWSTAESLMDQLIGLHIEGRIMVQLRSGTRQGQPCEIALIRNDS